MKRKKDKIPWARSAVISPDGKYRYRLERWSPEIPDAVSSPPVVFLMLNPSTANADVDDPTIRRCMGFATAWGYHRIVVGNLFAFRSPYTAILKKAPEPVGPDNDVHLAEIVAEAGVLIAAWGDDGNFQGRDMVVREIAEERRKVGGAPPLQHLGLTKIHSRPRHPLYLKSTAQRTDWPPPRVVTCRCGHEHGVHFYAKPQSCTRCVTCTGFELGITVA